MLPIFDQYVRFTIIVITVNVKIDDADNYSPVFVQSSYQFTISAYSDSGVSVGTVSATDGDTGPFGSFVFNFSTPSLYFAVSIVIILARFSAVTCINNVLFFTNHCNIN